MAKPRHHKSWQILITCEHAGHKIPSAFLNRMTTRQQADLATHRGWDRGALVLARHAAVTLDVPLYYTEISRLLVDCNRSPHHPKCFGPAFRYLPEAEKKCILAAYYWPHRHAIEKEIMSSIKKEMAVLHLAMHSFTPVLAGEKRKAELGLLYDPGRPWEKLWSSVLMSHLKRQWPDWILRRNYPYLGKSDGLSTWLRKKYSPESYVGIEVEWNQALFADNISVSSIKRSLAHCLKGLLPPKYEFPSLQ